MKSEFLQKSESEVGRLSAEPRTGTADVIPPDEFVTPRALVHTHISANLRGWAAPEK
jgi:hypothetical protein